jgi:hypothetical protein
MRVLYNLQSDGGILAGTVSSPARRDRLANAVALWGARTRYMLEHRAGGERLLLDEILLWRLFWSTTAVLSCLTILAQTAGALCISGPGDIHTLRTTVCFAC